MARPELKPVLLVGVVMAGVGATALAFAVARRARRRSRWLAPSDAGAPSPLAIAAKSGGLWAMRLLVRRVTEELVNHLSEKQLSGPTGAPGVAAPTHAAAAE
jgi:hypothetical protein